MRILHAIDSCAPSAGGVAEAVIRLSEAMHELGVDATIVSGDDPNASFLADLQVKVHALGPSRLGSYGYLPTMRSWLQEHATSQDAVVVHGLWQYPSVVVRKALRGCSTPYYLYPHGMLDPWFRKAYPWKHLKKALFWKLSQSKVLQDARSVCFTTDEERRLAQNTFSPYQCRETVVGLGSVDPPAELDTHKETFYRKFPQARDRKIMLFLARIHPKKGADMLLQAFGEIATGSDLLVLAGPCEDHAHAQQLRATASGFADRVLWTGMLEGNLKWGALRAAEALALPSHQENFGIVVAEALAVGTPVLISDKVNLWREVVEDDAGVVAPDDIDGTRTLLKHAATKGLEKERQNARQCFEKRFSIRRGAANLHELIQGDL